MIGWDEIEDQGKHYELDQQFEDLGINTSEQIEEFLQEWSSETRAGIKTTKIRDYCDDDEYKKFWTCKICKRDTSTVDYDYLVANDLHLECALKKEMVSVEYTWRDDNEES